MEVDGDVETTESLSVNSDGYESWRRVANSRCPSRMRGRHFVLAYERKMPWGGWSPRLALGPHWPGILIICGFIAAASNEVIGTYCTAPWEMWLGRGFEASTLAAILSTALHDPGFVDEECSSIVLSDDAFTDDLSIITCSVCAIPQPPGAVHCTFCNRCVRGHDHHCVWSGQCIGEGNMRSFKWFNTSWVLFVAYALVLMFRV